MKPRPLRFLSKLLFGLVAGTLLLGGVAPGDTVDLRLVEGVLISGCIVQDPEDDPIEWDQVYVNAGINGAVPDDLGDYSLTVDSGSYYIEAVAAGYVTDPQVKYLNVFSDTAGVDFVINRAHCRVTGTLLGVPLPLEGPYYVVVARTGTSLLDGYFVVSQVDSATGTYSMDLCDGDWVILPPAGVPADQMADSVLVTIGEPPENEVTVDLDYSSGCCEGIRGNVNASPDDFINIIDMTWLASYLFTGGEESPCFEEADINGDGQINIVDMTWLAAYLFTGGADPVACP